MVVYAFPSPGLLTIRRFDRSDATAMLRVFREAVRRGAAEHYTERQRTAWAPTFIDLTEWTSRRAVHRTWVAERRGEVVGFTDLTQFGEIDMLYVHPEHTRSGVGAALIDEAERCARDLGIVRLHARTSLVAEPLFQRRGFVIRSRQLIDLRGERFAQATVEKLLEPIA